MAETLYQRLGGVERIAAIIEESLDRHAVNPVLAPRLRGKDLPQLKQLALQVLCMSLSEQELAAAIEDIVAALDGHGVAPAEAGEVVAFLRSLTTGSIPRPS